MSTENPFEAVPCRDCGEPRLRMEWRPLLHALPMGSWSLAGAQPKTSAVERRWPWCVCDGCGRECAGKREEKGASDG